MVLDSSEKKKAIRTGINVIGKALEKDTPKGFTGNLAKIKISVKEQDLATQGIARSSAFYDIFENFGTSQQKHNIGYFDRSILNSQNKAISEVAKVIFNKMR